MNKKVIVWVSNDKDETVFRGSAEKLLETIPSLDLDDPNAYEIIEKHKYKMIIIFKRLVAVI